MPAVPRLLRLYGRVFAAAGVLFLAAPSLVARLLRLPAAGGALWLGLSGSLMAAITVLALGLSVDPENALAWRALLCAKAVSAGLFVVFAALGGGLGLVAAAGIDAAILAHLAYLRRRAFDGSDPLAPRWRGALGRFHEAWFARVNDPRTGAAFWLRWWLDGGDRPTASCRLIVYAPGRAAAERAWSRPAREALREPGAHFSLGPCRLEGNRAEGALDGASWSLRWDDGGAPRFSFVPPALTALGLAGAQYVSAPPLARFSGKISVAGREYELEDAPGMIGHSWGARMAERWRWGQVLFERPGAAPVVFEILSARVRVLGLTSPWITSANLWHEGRRYAPAGLAAGLASSGRREGDRWTFEAALSGARVEGDFWMDEAAAARVELEAPDGGRRVCLNSKIADARLRVSLPGRAPIDLSCAARAAFERVDPA